MVKIDQYIFNKNSNETISIDFIGKNFIYDCSYEDFKNEFITRLTPKDFLEDEEQIDEVYECPYERIQKKILDIFPSEVPTIGIKDLSVEGRIFKVESYTLDSLSYDINKIIISDDLLNDEKFVEILYLIVKIFENNRIELIKQFYAIKKKNENRELINNDIYTYLDNKKSIYNIIKEEVIIIDASLHNQQNDFLDYFAAEYSVRHPIKLISCMGIPLITLLVILKGIFKIPVNLFGGTVYITSIGIILYSENKMWKRIIYNRLIDFQRKLEKQYNISYDVQQKRVLLKNKEDFYDVYTKCVKNTLEFAYSKLTTPLEDEIKGLNLLLNEYKNSKNTPFEKAYFATRLLVIKKQILLKESNEDKKNSFKDDEIKFAKRYIIYLTGKNITMLDDDRINQYLEKIKQSEERELCVFTIDLIMGLVEYIYRNYLQEIEKKEPMELESNIEYDIDMILEKVVGK